MNVLVTQTVYSQGIIAVWQCGQCIYSCAVVLYVYTNYLPPYHSPNKSFLASLPADTTRQWRRSLVGGTCGVCVCVCVCVCV